ncbi:MAG: mechanosensitive ion channel family protein [Pseudomonadota bacterium]
MAAARRMLCAIFLAFILTVALSYPGLAQDDATPAEPAAGAQSDEPAADTPPGDEASNEADTPSTAAADPALTNPKTPLNALQTLTVPLTADELATLTEQWRGIVQAELKKIADLQVKLFATEGDAADALRDQIAAGTQDRNAVMDRYGAVVNAWETKGGNPDEIAAARSYVTAVTAQAAQTTDARTLAILAWEWLISWNGGLAILWKAVVFFVSLYVLVLVARIARGVVRKRVGRIPKTSKLLQAFLVTITYWLVLSFGLMVVLAAMGVNITPLFALVGGASFIIAFAMQDTLSNLANGLLIMITRPFDEGDFVIVGGTGGSVKSVNVVSTTITTPDNQVIVMPNKQVWGTSITNVTASDIRRVDLVFGISYDDDIRKALSVLREAVAAHELALQEPAPAFAVGELAESSVNLLCRPWVKTVNYWTLYWDLMADVKTRFDEAGISIPYPQQDVYVHNAAPDAPDFYRPQPSAPGATDKNPPPPAPVDIE